MRLLLVHQNFPGQFRQLAPHLESRGHELVAICSHQRPVALKGRVLRYQEPEKLSGVPLGSQLWHDGLQRSTAVASFAQSLDRDGWKPDRSGFQPSLSRLWAKLATAVERWSPSCQSWLPRGTPDSFSGSWYRSTLPFKATGRWWLQIATSSCPRLSR